MFSLPYLEIISSYDQSAACPVRALLSAPVGTFSGQFSPSIIATWLRISAHWRRSSPWPVFAGTFTSLLRSMTK
jgi:hypothetical protein